MIVSPFIGIFTALSRYHVSAGGSVPCPDCQPFIGIFTALSCYHASAGGSVPRPAGPVKGGSTIIAFAKDPTG